MFFCKLEGFTCQKNVLRLSCCSNFCHKKCQEVWKKTWRHCGRCRTQIENEEETRASQLESTEAEENPTVVLRSLMSYTPQGYSETMLEYFRFGNTSHFKQKMAILCAHLLHGCDVRKIYLLLRFDNPQRLRLYFDHLKRLLLPFCREFRTMLSVANCGAFDGHIIFTLSDNGCKCASFEL